MAVGVFAKLGGTTIEITLSELNDLVRDSEQLRILKNYLSIEEHIYKGDIEKLLKAMEADNE